jgi:N-acetylneuraminic acid mutarotase
VDEYDPELNTWRSRASMPVTLGEGTQATTATNGYIYVAGSSSDVRPLLEYSPEDNVWTTRANMPSRRFFPGMIGSSDGKVYVVGGFEPPSEVATVFEYNIGTDTWQTKASLPASRMGMGVADASGKIFVIGGHSSTTPVHDLARVDVYDPSTDAWAPLLSMPTPRSFLGATFGPGGLIYAVGGRQGLAFMATAEAYDPQADRWKIEDIPPDIAAFDVNGTALVTTSTAVTLALMAADAGGSGVSQMSFSNDGGVTWSGWEAFAATKAWTLTSGDGPKTVHARARDVAGNVSNAVGDSIVLLMSA